MTVTLWLSFFGASLLLAIAPGPDNLFVLTQSAVYGFRSGLWVVCGLVSGLLVQTLCAAGGVAAVVAAVPVLFMTIKMAGATYLLYLAWGAWKHAANAINSTPPVHLNSIQLWRRGLIMNITNLKVQIFFLAFFPQFVDQDTTGLALVLQMMIQGLTFILATLIVFSALAWVAGKATDRWRSPRFMLLLNRVSAIIFVLLACFTLAE